MKIQLTVQVHSDRPIERPRPYFKGVFKSFRNCWELVDVTGPTMTVKSDVFTVSDEVDPKDFSVKMFDCLTPNMFTTNVTRTYSVL